METGCWDFHNIFVYRGVQLNAKASEARVAHGSELDLGTLSSNTGLAIHALNTLASLEHEHREWHSQAFVINIELARRDFKTARGHTLLGSYCAR